MADPRTSYLVTTEDTRYLVTEIWDHRRRLVRVTLADEPEAPVVAIEEHASIDGRPLHELSTRDWVGGTLVIGPLRTRRIVAVEVIDDGPGRRAADSLAERPGMAIGLARGTALGRRIEAHLLQGAPPTAGPSPSAAGSQPAAPAAVDAVPAVTLERLSAIEAVAELLEHVVADAATFAALRAGSSEHARLHGALARCDERLGALRARLGR